MCPNKNQEEYKKLVAEFGEGKALAAWVLNHDVTPSIEEANTLLKSNSPIYHQLSPQDAVDRIVKGFKSLVPKYTTGNKFIGYGTRTGIDLEKVAKEIANWIKDKPDFSGISVFVSNEGVLKFRDKATGKFYQLTHNLNNSIKQTKNELQRIIAGESQERKGDLIQTALDYYRNSEKAIGDSESQIGEQNTESFEGFVKRELLPKSWKKYCYESK